MSLLQPLTEQRYASNSYFSIKVKQTAPITNISWSQAYDVLAKHHSLRLEDLSSYPHVSECYEFISSILQATNMEEMPRNLSYNVHDELVRMIQSDYVPSHVNPDTIGAKLYGCVYRYYGVVEGQCSALCLESMLISDTNHSCHDQVWRYKEGNFIKMNKSKTRWALVYLDNVDEKPSNSDYTVLRNAGVTQIHLLGTKNGHHYYVKRNVSLFDDLTEAQQTASGFYQYMIGAYDSEDLEDKQEQLDQTRYKKRPYEKQATKERTKLDNYFLYMVIIFIIVLLLLFLLHRNMR